MNTDRVCYLFKVTITATTGLLLFTALLHRPISFGQTQTLVNARIEVLGLGKTLPERLGPQDNAIFAIHYTGDIHGNLDTCG